MWYVLRVDCFCKTLMKPLELLTGWLATHENSNYYGSRVECQSFET